MTEKNPSRPPALEDGEPIILHATEIEERPPIAYSKILSVLCTTRGKLAILLLALLLIVFSFYSDDNEDLQIKTYSHDDSQIMDIVMDEPDLAPMNCSSSEIEKFPFGSHSRLVKEADCGSGYKFGESSSGSRPVRVLLYGENIQANLRLTGCLTGPGRCPHHPKCYFNLETTLLSPAINAADVVVVSTEDAKLMPQVMAKANKHKKVRRVLYWREPYWRSVSVAQQKAHFDVTMGCFYDSGILNPLFIRRPHTLVAKTFFKFLPFSEREQFALSIVSNCAANSGRQEYIDHLTDYLGTSRVHQYGKCGDRKLPPPPINHAAKVISKYKFFLSFENTIMNGYVSEKLFTVLNMQLLPVYLGARDVPNITLTPSFIHVFDFKTPKHLAEYLLYLDANPEAYEAYHLWRKDTSYFDHRYLEIVKYQFPSQGELKVYHHRDQANRAAACCRLCNLEFLDDRIKERTESSMLHTRLQPEKINHLLFAGMMHRRPGPGHVLDAEQRKKKG